MALVDLWKKDKSQLVGKHIQQVIAFAGEGKLTDDSVASTEFREYLRNVPTSMLADYTGQCLLDAFPNSGLALQDIVNEVGRRVGFDVTHGRYRGSQAHLGHDGIWVDQDKHSIVVEVKTTDAYRIDLDTVAKYRQLLAKSEDLEMDRSSMLVVVGRQDTGDLEAQIRGSRHAWEMRVISVEALLRMLHLKEEVEDPTIAKRIHQILIPREFTRLDQIVDIAFAAVEDLKEEAVTAEEEPDEKKFTPVAFHTECIGRIELALNLSLVKQSRASFTSPDGTTRLLCAVSRFHEREKRYWFAFHPHQAKFLKEGNVSYVAFGCGNAATLFLIPYSTFEPWLEYFNKSVKGERSYWHVKIRASSKAFMMVGREGTKSFDITPYLVKAAVPSGKAP